MKTFLLLVTISITFCIFAEQSVVLNEKFESERMIAYYYGIINFRDKCLSGHLQHIEHYTSGEVRDNCYYFDIEDASVGDIFRELIDLKSNLNGYDHCKIQNRCNALIHIIKQFSEQEPRKNMYYESHYNVTNVINATVCDICNSPMAFIGSKVAVQGKLQKDDETWRLTDYCKNELINVLSIEKSVIVIPGKDTDLSNSPQNYLVGDVAFYNDELLYDGFPFRGNSLYLKHSTFTNQNVRSASQYSRVNYLSPFQEFKIVFNSNDGTAYFLTYNSGMVKFYKKYKCQSNDTVAVYMQFSVYDNESELYEIIDSIKRITGNYQLKNNWHFTEAIAYSKLGWRVIDYKDNPKLKFMFQFLEYLMGKYDNRP